MRSNEVFAQMTPERMLGFLEEVREHAPRVSAIALTAAAEAFKLRPQFLRRQPRERQADWVRRALGRKLMAPIAEEVLAEYFLEHKKDLLTEWLDAVGLEHEKGMLKGEVFECPSSRKLKQVVESFRKGEDSPGRELLLRAFVAQTSIEWPALEALL